MRITVERNQYKQEYALQKDWDSLKAQMILSMEIETMLIQMTFKQAMACG